MKKAYFALLLIVVGSMFAQAEESSVSTEVIKAVDAVAAPRITAMWLLFRDQDRGAQLSDPKTCLAIGEFNQAVLVTKLTGGLTKLANEYPQLDIDGTIELAKKAQESCK